MLRSLLANSMPLFNDYPVAKLFCRSVAGLQFADVLQGTDAAIMVHNGNNELHAEINWALEETRMGESRICFSSGGLMMAQAR